MLSSKFLCHLSTTGTTVAWSVDHVSLHSVLWRQGHRFTTTVHAQSHAIRITCVLMDEGYV